LITFYPVKLICDWVSPLNLNKVCADASGMSSRLSCHLVDKIHHCRCLNITFGEITLCHNLDYESTPSESAGYDRNTKDRLVCFQEAPASTHTHTHIDPAM